MSPNPQSANGSIRSEINVTPLVDVRETRVADSGLMDTLTAIHAAEPDREVIVRGDRHLQYERISEVLTLIRRAGFTRVGLIAERGQESGGG
jgi:biopolymer transport protein TolR